MSAFYYNYHNFQSYVQQGTSLTVFNTPAISKGGEAQLTLNPLKGLKLELGYSALNAFQVGVPYRGVVSDRPMANAPHETVNGLARYEWPAFGVKLNAQLNSYYIGPHYWSGVDPPALHAPGYTIVDAQVGLKTQNDRWEFGIWVKNLANKNYFTLGFEDTTLWGTGGYVPGTPRWFGGTVRFKFK
jgi:iron complex outermembrane receptor protein